LIYNIFGRRPVFKIHKLNRKIMDVFEITQVTDEIVEAFQRLVPQLSSSNPPPTRAELEDLVGSRASILLGVRDPDRDNMLVGSLTLAVFRVPTGIRAWIEDVVVDGESRSKGIGELLTRAAIERAKQEGAVTVDLTSRPSREAANRLYVRVGFVARQTNIYRFNIVR
jgi:ribosomal protein S18 acetylase RimI-like enzyme